MTEAPQRFPLSWPAHRPRTPSYRRKGGTFKTGGKLLTPAEAMTRVEAEIERMGGKYPLLSSNLELRMDGRPRGDRPAPADPGVCLYFALKSEPFALACDTYSNVAQNIAALAAHLEATRAIERHGVASAAESLQAFSALPPPAAMGGDRPWHEVLGFTRDFGQGLSSAEAALVIQARYRDRAQTAHPDRGGSASAMSELNAARDAALKSIGA